MTSACAIPSKLCLRAADALAPFVAHPPAQHWLCSDASKSFCWPCARLARWFEMDRIGPPPPETEWFERTDVEEEVVEGIDGGEWYSGESDTPAYCAGCGRVLRFCLTAYGVEYTSEGFEPGSIDLRTIENSEAAYELREMLEQGAWIEDRGLRKAVIQVARETLSVVRRAHRPTRRTSCPAGRRSALQ